MHALLRLVSAQKEQHRDAVTEILGLAGFTHASRPYLRDVGDHLAQVPASCIARPTT